MERKAQNSLVNPIVYLYRTAAIDWESVARDGKPKILLERIVMKREVMKSIVWALLVAVLLGVAIVVGSRNLSRFDSALVAYTFA